MPVAILSRFLPRTRMQIHLKDCIMPNLTKLSVSNTVPANRDPNKEVNGQLRASQYRQLLAHARADCSNDNEESDHQVLSTRKDVMIERLPALLIDGREGSMNYLPNHSSSPCWCVQCIVCGRSIVDLLSLINFCSQNRKRNALNSEVLIDKIFTTTR